MIGRLRNLFGKSGTEPKAGAPAPQAPAAAAPAPGQETPAEAERRLMAAVSEAERAGGAGVGLSDSLTRLADFKMRHDHATEAEQLLRRVLAIEEAAVPMRPGRLVTALANLAATAGHLGKKAEAESFYRRAIECCDGSQGVGDGLVVTVLENLAALCSEGRRYDECEPLIVRSIALRERIYGRMDNALVIPLTNLADVYRYLRRYRDSETTQRRLIALLESLRGPDHLDVAHQLHYLVGACVDQGLDAEAEKECRRALAIYEKNAPPDLVGGAGTLANLALILRRLKRPDEAEEAYKQAVLTCDVGGDSCRTVAVHVLNGYAEFLRERGREAEAKTHAARAAELGAAAAQPRSG